VSAHYLRVPILRKLFYEVAEPGQLETMNLPEVLDWAGGAEPCWRIFLCHVRREPRCSVLLRALPGSVRS
jgi:hypothetical protein